MSRDINETAPRKLEEIRRVLIELISGSPGGMRYADLHRAVLVRLPNAKPNTVHGALNSIVERSEGHIYKPERGLFMSRSASAPELPSAEHESVIAEQDFYESFGSWLTENDYCTKTAVIGGNKLGNRALSKWQTPDVLGINKPSDIDVLKPPIEVVSAEIKVNATELITGFGQACAYRLFSHRSFVVVPKDADVEQLARLDSLCALFGLGLVLFDRLSTDDPKYDERIRPQRFEPDYFYANKVIEGYKHDLFA